MLSHSVIVKVPISPRLTWYQEAKEARQDRCTWPLPKSKDFDLNYTTPPASTINYQTTVSVEWLWLYLRYIAPSWVKTCNFLWEALLTYFSYKKIVPVESFQPALHKASCRESLRWFADTPHSEQGALPASATAAHALTPAAGRAPAHLLPGAPAPLQLPVKFLLFTFPFFISYT